jgi:uncharacterized protein with FMN-binding domain
MSSVVSRAKQSRLLRPVFAALAAALVFVGCSPATPQQNGAATSSSTSSADAMMKREDGDAMEKEEGDDVMEKEDGDDAMMKKESSSSSAAAATSSASAAKATGMYKDGTYAAAGAYFSPAGPEAIQVSVTLKNDVITDAKVTGDATNDKSIKLQNLFIAGFSEQVVGKSIDSVSLGVVNGSSLTPMGFMNALKAIKQNAKA